ncbi:hypothetical protein EP073_02000 [Geovibrio thiophilus]|uniref:Uncharacterized protein n=1 Tax=Geovibrio thiophilus TaxID=139438 RepID=A0A3R5YY04_9BACT|nr:hypothetical protein [Geovibrio thiophilus]QAR32210.1 hypothetical protein EP073_02000 [Geovibrio thiophilus]
MSRIDESGYFHKAMMITKAMFPGVFIYLVFAGLSKVFDWNIFLYLSPDTVRQTGFVFVALSVVSFPLAREVEKHAVKNAKTGDGLLKRLYFSTLINLGIGEISAFFGVIIYVMSGDIRYFFLFFNICLLHIILNRPTYAKWKKHMRERFTSLPDEDD